MGGRRWNTSKESIASPEGKLISALRLVRSYGACEPLARAVPEGRFLLRSEDLCRLLSGLGEAIWRLRRAAQRTTFVSVHWRLEGSERFSTSDAG
jgi:hypothetical protein